MDSLFSFQNWHSIPAYEYPGLDSEQASAERTKDDEEEVFTWHITPASFCMF